MNAPSLEDQIGDLHTAARSDLEITRRFEHGEPIYVIHDPSAFTTQTLSVEDYLIFAAINPDLSLREVFESLVSQGRLDESEREDFYQFVLALRKLNLLGHSGGSGKELYEQHLDLQRAKKKGGLMKWLSPKFALVNPDQFLNLTIGLATFLFSPLFVALWAISGLVAISIVCARAGEFSASINGVLASGNLGFVWGSFILVKFWHELGHGYACKRYGGSVPEMGTMVMMGTPLAYVDASSAWSFESRLHRLIVMVGGMYFESMCSIAAVFVWALSDSPMVSSCAFQLVLMTSVTTVLFNANPLMKYDGYYVLAELVQIPNLRQLAQLSVGRWAKRIFLGVKQDSGVKLKWTSALLVFGYGIASTIYANLLTLSIATMLAYALPTIGLGLAAYYIAMNFGSKFLKTGTYLLAAEELQQVRWRARCVALLAFIALPAAAVWMPTPFRILTTGVLASETESLIRAEESGILEQSFVSAGRNVQLDQPLVRLDNFKTRQTFSTAYAELQQANVEFAHALEQGPEAMTRAREAYRRKHEILQDSQANVAQLTARAKTCGQLAHSYLNGGEGSFIQVGDPIGLILCGDKRIRTYLTEKELLRAQAFEGKSVQFAIIGQLGRRCSGKILEVSMTSETEFKDLALTQLNGGEILVDPESKQAVETLYQITIEADEILDADMFHGRRAYVFFDRKYEPFGWYVYRALSDFVSALYVS